MHSKLKSWPVQIVQETYDMDSSAELFMYPQEGCFGIYLQTHKDDKRSIFTHRPHVSRSTDLEKLVKIRRISVELIR